MHDNAPPDLIQQVVELGDAKEMTKGTPSMFPSEENTVAPWRIED